MNISKKKLTPIVLISIFFLMLGLSFAAVPLYDLFCRVTGYGGTVQRSSIAPGSLNNLPKIQIRFDANISNDLEWEFVAPENKVLVEPGVQKIIYYRAKNLSDKTSIGTASFNVSPPKAGAVFMKVDCFCFERQELKPGEEMKMPVAFYIDPKIYDEKNTKNLKEIILSYTFFKVKLKSKDKNV
mgnify:CR=1 FL=1